MSLDSSFIFWSAQAIGLVGLVFVFIAFQTKTRNGHLRQQMISSIFFIAHYALLGAWTGTLGYVIIALRNLVFSQKDTHRWAQHVGWLIFFYFLPVAALFVSWQGFISILPVVSVIIGTYARWKHGAFEIRLAAVAGFLLWLPYALYVQSYAGALTQAVVAVSTLLGMYKYHEFADLHLPNLKGGKSESEKKKP